MSADSEKVLDPLISALEPRFPESPDLNVLDFLRVEMLLMLADMVDGPRADVTKADRLLSNYCLIRPETFGKTEHLLQLARRHLLQLSSATTWRKHLDLYQKPKFRPIRMYDIEDGCAIPREELFGGIDRAQVYLSYLLEPPKIDGSVSFAVPGRKYHYVARPEPADVSQHEEADNEERAVTIPDTAPHVGGAFFPAHRGPRDPITISLAEMIEVAEEVGRKTGATHYVAVLQQALDQGLLKAVLGAEAKPTDRMTLDKVTNLVGLVGAGKSVFATILIITLARQGHRVASLLNSVSDVMGTILFLRHADVRASPLVSKRERVSHLNELIDQSSSMLLDDDVARYLETPCIIDGLGETYACSYESTPCHGLMTKKGAPRTCPYWSICPSQAMAREAMTSDVVITTPAGFAHMTVGPQRNGFFELALADFDLVIFDEADRVQVQLDDSFAPEIKMHELIYSCADPTARAMKRPPQEKLRNLNEEKYYDLRQSAEPIAKALLLAARQPEIADWKVVGKEAFTSLTLLNSLVNSGLPAEIASALESRIGGYVGQDPLLDNAIALACRGIDDATMASYQFALDQYLGQLQLELAPATRTRLSFLLTVIGFDEFLRQLATASEYLAFKDEAISDLYDFLRFSHVRQQRYLPSSLIGNIFGMRMTEDNALVLFRQFAFGRAFMNSLPWLDTDEEGRPCGPHALLLSGSSYEPGCLQYHVNRPVDYLLEAQPWVAEKLAETQVTDLGIQQNVSGSSQKNRRRNLGIVLSELTDTLESELAESPGKALLVVNSYDEAESAREQFEQLLRSHGSSEKVCALTRDSDADGGKDKRRFVRRSEVYRFASHPARILIAPAMAIERGFNIVDATGHAAFSTLVFCVRPMSVPHDIGARYRRVNGLMEGQVNAFAPEPAAFASQVRTTAWRQWKILEKDESLAPKMWAAAGRETLMRDATATLLATVVQLFGRLARLRDPKRPAPHVYFADAAFRGPENRNVASFRALEELGGYLQNLIENSPQPAVAKALYGPFYEAFKKGIQE